MFPPQNAQPEIEIEDGVGIAICHCETPLRRRRNLMFTITYEIASVVALPRKDNATHPQMRGMSGDRFLKIVFKKSARRRRPPFLCVKKNTAFILRLSFVW